MPDHKFQSTLPRGERPFTAALSSLFLRFQSTLPRGERPRSNIITGCSLCNFNPRSHEGSDAQSEILRQKNIISIHAPTRGATILVTFMEYPDGISIHAPTRGATLREWNDGQYTGNFNPRSHEGSDDKLLSSGLYCIDISIHAPTRGATVDHAVVHKQYKISIHAPTRGATILTYLVDTEK